MSRLALIILMFICTVYRKRARFGLTLLFFTVTTRLFWVLSISASDPWGIRCTKFLYLYSSFFWTDVFVFSSLMRLKSSWVLFWLDQLFLFPGLVLYGTGFRLWMGSQGGSQQSFCCVLGHFRHGDKQTNNQPGDPRASLLLTSEKAVFCKKVIVHIDSAKNHLAKKQSELNTIKMRESVFSLP